MMFCRPDLASFLSVSVTLLCFINDPCDAAVFREARESSLQRVGNMKDKEAKLDDAFRELRASFMQRHADHHNHSRHGAFHLVPKSTTSAPSEEAFVGPIFSYGKRQTFLQTSKTAYVDIANDSDNVLFTVWTDSKFYDTRLRGILNTWGKELPKDRFMAVSDKKRQAEGGDSDAVDNNAPGTSQVEETRCPPHSHWEGACCKWAEGVLLAHKRMERNPSLKWAFFSDDDVYLRPAAVASSLRSYDNETTKPLALGIFGCQTASGCAGLCGGGGFAMNRAAVTRMADEDPAAFLKEEMGYCQKCERWADQAISMIWRDKGVEMRQLPGLHGWKMTESDFKEQVSNGSPNLLFHYQQSVNQMETLHELFTGEKLLPTEAGPCVDFEGHHACMASSDCTDNPFTCDPHDLRNGR